MSVAGRRRQAVRAAIVMAVAVLLVQGVLVWPAAWDEVQLRTGLGLPHRTLPAMAIVAHDGDLDAYPENTLEAITAAVAAGADGVEFDVQRSASGTWWVIHDPTLDRTTDRSGEIRLLSDAEIAAAVVDGGFGYDPARHIGLHVPRLQDVLEALAGSPVEIYVDLQHAWTGGPAELIALLAGRPATIICRNASDVHQVALAGRPTQSLTRRMNADAAAAVDGWLVDAHREVSPSRVAASSLPYVTFVDASEYGQDEGVLLRRAWASNVSAYLTRHLSAALIEREQLLSASQPPNAIGSS